MRNKPIQGTLSPNRWPLTSSVYPYVFQMNQVSTAAIVASAPATAPGSPAATNPTVVLTVSMSVLLVDVDDDDVIISLESNESSCT